MSLRLNTMIKVGLATSLLFFSINHQFILLTSRAVSTPPGTRGRDFSGSLRRNGNQSHPPFTEVPKPCFQEQERRNGAAMMVATHWLHLLWRNRHALYYRIS